MIVEGAIRLPIRDGPNRHYGDATVSIAATINGKPIELPYEVSVAEFLSERALLGRRLAVAHNGRVVQSEHYGTTRIRDGDTLEVVRPVGGG